MFLHREQRLPRHNLTRVDDPAGRFYLHEDGSKFQSVTTFLGSLGNASLDEWRRAVGEEQANEIANRAARKGTRVHLACEKYINNEVDYSKDLWYDEKYDFNQLRKVLDTRVGLVWEQEFQMYSRLLGLAGTCDMIAEFDGVLSIIDFKTSNAIKYDGMIDSYYLQEACYAIMANELYGLKITQLVTIIAVSQSHAEVFVQKMAPWGRKIIELRGQYEPTR